MILPPLVFPGYTVTQKAGNVNLRGMLSTVGLLYKVDCFEDILGFYALLAKAIFPLRKLSAITAATATRGCTCLGHLGRHDTSKKILSVSCCPRWLRQEHSLSLSPTFSPKTLRQCTRAITGCLVSNSNEWLSWRKVGLSESDGAIIFLKRTKRS